MALAPELPTMTQAGLSMRSETYLSALFAVLVQNCASVWH